MAKPIHSGFVTSSDPDKPRSEAAVPFRDIIPAPDHPRICGIDSLDAHAWCESRRHIDAPGWLINRLDAKNLERPLKGFTTDGHVKRGVYRFPQDEGAPTQAMVRMAEGLVGLLSAEEQKSTLFPSVDVDDIRLWSNPTLYVNPGGVRLDECSEEIQAQVHRLLKASFSDHGYQKVLGCCLTNGFLGQLVNGRKVLNEHSYNLRLFGTPSLTAPWGYTFFGHHLCLCVVVKGGCMVVGPNFLGAEPDQIDQGPHAGLRLFQEEELLPLQLMNSLPGHLRRRATLSTGMTGKDLPEDRWNPFDERHVGGARQDNRVLPYEGCPVALFDQAQQDVILQLFRAFNAYYPAAVLAHKEANFREHLGETYFAWIGEHGDDDPFYYRIHSPVALLELDFHCGIFLTNTSPARCHIHTVIRLPNLGDYGRALVEGL